MHKENGTDCTQTRAAVAVSDTVDGNCTHLGRSRQRYATSLAGPWTAMTDVGNDTAYGSQTAYVLPAQGSSGTPYLYMGDRWGNSFGGTVNDSQYIWLPLTFPTTRTMDLPWYPRIAVDTVAGTVTGVGGGPHCNFVARHSGKCLDVKDASTIQWTCGTGTNQQFQQRMV